MRNSRGIDFNIGNKVKFQYKINNKVDTGTIKNIDGEYVHIEFEIDGKKYICDRYRDEILKVLN